MQPWLLRFVIPQAVPIVGGQDLSIPLLFILAALGYIAATFALIREAEREGVAPKPLLDLSLLILFLSILGGRLGYALLGQPQLFLSSPALFFDVWLGGMSFWGGLALCLGALVVFARKKGVDALALGDLFAPALSLGLVLGWAGALASGAGYGKPIDFPLGWELPWGVIFYDGQVPELLRGVRLHPTQVYFALLNLALFLGLTRLRGRQSFQGQVVLAWGLLFSVGSFILEAFRYDYDRGVYVGGWLSASQIICIVTAGACAALYMRRRSSAHDSQSTPLGAPGSPLAG